MKHKAFIEQISEELARYTTACDCPKGGLVGDNELPCEKCGGNEWVLPWDILQAFTKAIENYREEMRLKGIGIGREDGGGYGKAHLEIEKKDKEYFL